MTRIAVIIASVAILVSPALAGGLPPHPGEHARITLVAKHAPQTTTSRMSVPATAQAICDVTFNGHHAQMIWNDSPQVLEYAWHGMIATLSFHKKAGPVTLRVASTRRDHIRVRATVSWSR